MNLGLVYAAFVEGDEQALAELDDCFEENNLARCKGKFEIYYVYFDSQDLYGMVDEDYIPNCITFSSVRERDAFIRGLEELAYNGHYNYDIVTAFSKEEFNIKLNDFINEYMTDDDVDEDFNDEEDLEEEDLDDDTIIKNI